MYELAIAVHSCPSPLFGWKPLSHNFNILINDLVSGEAFCLLFALSRTGLTNSVSSLSVVPETRLAKIWQTCDLKSPGWGRPGPLGVRVAVQPVTPLPSPDSTPSALPWASAPCQSPARSVTRPDSSFHLHGASQSIHAKSTSAGPCICPIH